MPDIRRLTPADADQWVRLRHALWPETGLEALQAEVAGYQPADSDDTIALGAFAGPDLQGFAEASIRSSGSGCHIEKTPWLEGIYVDPAFRGQGVAAALVKGIEDWAILKGYAELGSDIRHDNAVSIARHSQWGFEQTQQVVLLRKRLK